MSTAGALTIRFADGEQWTIPFSVEDARQLAQLLDVDDPPEWLLLGDPDVEDPEHILFVRPEALQSMAWEREDAGGSDEPEDGDGNEGKSAGKGTKPIVPMLLKGLGEGLDPERRKQK
jgi:hypothetical protein